MVSEEGSQDGDKCKKNWPKDQEDEELAALIEKSIKHKEDVHEKE